MDGNKRNLDDILDWASRLAHGSIKPEMKNYTQLSEEEYKKQYELISNKRQPLKNYRVLSEGLNSTSNSQTKILPMNQPSNTQNTSITNSNQRSGMYPFSGESNNTIRFVSELTRKDADKVNKSYRGNMTFIIIRSKFPIKLLSKLFSFSSIAFLNLIYSLYLSDEFVLFIFILSDRYLAKLS